MNLRIVVLFQQSASSIQPFTLEFKRLTFSVSCISTLPNIFDIFCTAQGGFATCRLMPTGYKPVGSDAGEIMAPVLSYRFTSLPALL